MESLADKLDASRWFERWEAMQNGYIPQRLYRFDLMLQLAVLPRDSEVQILDLGCGPGSLALRALQYYPQARVVAVDSDPVLLALGEQVAQERHSRIRFLQADIRQGDWWAAYSGTFDLAMSATALHWLNAEHLTQTYQRIYQALKPGGCFMNSDHIASDDAATQAQYRQMLRERQQAAFRATDADSWDGFWQKLGAELNWPDLDKLRGEAELWEGSDDGLPKGFHLAALRECGFARIAFHWQDLGEAVIGAQRPYRQRASERSAPGSP